MTDATMLAPAGTIHTLLTSLGIRDVDAVRKIDIDPIGVITVTLLVRDPDGGFISGTYVDSPLPVFVTATLRFAEGENDKEPEYVSTGQFINGREVRAIQAYNTEMAIEALDVTTSGKAHDWHIIDDVGVRGELRTFTFAHNFMPTGA